MRGFAFKNRVFWHRKMATCGRVAHFPTEMKRTLNVCRSPFYLQWRQGTTQNVVWTEMRRALSYGCAGWNVCVPGCTGDGRGVDGRSRLTSRLFDRQHFDLSEPDQSILGVGSFTFYR